MDCGNETRKAEDFLPYGLSNPTRWTDGFCLLQRLAHSDGCFLVLADSDGQAHRNEWFMFPESLKRILRVVKNELDATGPARNPVELIQKAGKWYMDHTDFDSIEF
jgi:hypothetical protein